METATLPRNGTATKQIQQKAAEFELKQYGTTHVYAPFANIFNLLQGYSIPSVKYHQDQTRLVFFNSKNLWHFKAAFVAIMMLCKLNETYRYGSHTLTVRVKDDRPYIIFSQAILQVNNVIPEDRIVDMEINNREIAFLSTKPKDVNDDYDSRDDGNKDDLSSDGPF